MKRNNATSKSPRTGLARALSKLGYSSRTQAAELIRAGRVRLNGSIRRDPEVPVQLARDRIKVDDIPVRSADKVYLMMNKPRGLVTTASDEKDRATIYDLLKKDPTIVKRWLAPVGRLDKASEGLLLLTNDSEWGARIAAPETHLDKTYHVQVTQLLDEHELSTLMRAVRTEKGDILRVKGVRLLRQGQKNCWLEVVLDEGKNRQIRRLFEAINVGVLRLVRIAIGTLSLGDLPKGEFRALTREEKSQLDHCLASRIPT